MECWPDDTATVSLPRRDVLDAEVRGDGKTLQFVVLVAIAQPRRLRTSGGAVTARARRRAEPDDTSCVHGDESLVEPTANHGVGADHPATSADPGRFVDHFEPLHRPAALIRDSMRVSGRNSPLFDHGDLGFSSGPVAAEVQGH